jgi:hypothetical protein
MAFLKTWQQDAAYCALSAGLDGDMFARCAAIGAFALLAYSSGSSSYRRPVLAKAIESAFCASAGSCRLFSYTREMLRILFARNEARPIVALRSLNARNRTRPRITRREQQGASPVIAKSWHVIPDTYTGC